MSPNLEMLTLPLEMTTAAPDTIDQTPPAGSGQSRKPFWPRWKWDRENPSDNLDPVLVKEVRQGLRSKKFIVPFLLAQLALLIAVGVEVLEITALGTRETGELIFWIVLVLFVMALIPLTGLWAVASEYNGSQFELLRLSGLSRWRIIRGKWLSLMLQSLLVILSSVPYLLLRYLIGGLELFMALFIVAGLLAASANLIALCLAVSSFRTKLGRTISFVFLLGAFSFHAVWVVLSITWIAQMLSEFLGLAGKETLIYIMAPIQGGPSAIGSAMVLLAVASSKLRFYETIYGGDRGNSLAVLYAVSPYIMGFAALITAGFGIPIAWIIIAISAARGQREKDGQAELLYASQWISRSRRNNNAWQPRSPREAQRRAAYAQRSQDQPAPQQEKKQAEETESPEDREP